MFGNQGDKYILTTCCENSKELLKCPSGLVFIAPEEMVTAALQYFYRKATAEIFEFVDKTLYEKISLVKDQIIYYSGRILSTQEFGGNSSLGEAALDLTMSMFCVPLSDGSSPIARVNEVH